MYESYVELFFFKGKKLCQCSVGVSEMQVISNGWPFLDSPRLLVSMGAESLKEYFKGIDLRQQNPLMATILLTFLGIHSKPVPGTSILWPLK